MNRYVEAWLAAGVDPARAEELATRTEAGVIKDIAWIKHMETKVADYLAGEGYGTMTKKPKQGEKP